MSVAQGILAKAYGGPFYGWQIFITPENNNPLLFNANHGNENGGSYLYGPTSNEYNDGEWHNITITYESSIDQANFYFDGVMMSYFSSHGNLDLTNIGDFKIGTDRGNDSFLEGKIDVVSIWNKALTNSEVQSSIYSDLLGNEQGLVGLWKFDADYLEICSMITLEMQTMELLMELPGAQTCQSLAVLIHMLETITRVRMLMMEVVLAILIMETIHLVLMAVRTYLSQKKTSAAYLKSLVFFLGQCS